MEPTAARVAPVPTFVAAKPPRPKKARASQPWQGGTGAITGRPAFAGEGFQYLCRVPPLHSLMHRRKTCFNVNSRRAGSSGPLVYSTACTQLVPPDSISFCIAGMLASDVPRSECLQAPVPTWFLWRSCRLDWLWRRLTASKVTSWHTYLAYLRPPQALPCANLKGIRIAYDAAPVNTDL